MQAGDFIRVQDGPYTGMTGVFRSADDGWAWVRLTAWGRAVRLLLAAIAPEARYPVDAATMRRWLRERHAA